MGGKKKRKRQSEAKGAHHQSQHEVVNFFGSLSLLGFVYKNNTAKAAILEQAGGVETGKQRGNR